MLKQSHLFCIAPMMDWTDRHDRYFLRLITKHARLYTEMLTAQAILFGDRKRLLSFHTSEHPLALQIGGSDPLEMAECARIAESWGYDEVNINVGCPSDRVQAGRFGACLMKEQDLVAKCIEGMKKAVSIPITVKCRIGVDDQNPNDVLPKFISCVAGAGCDIFIIHARKAMLSGLSPADNRDIPPLDYPLVHNTKKINPDLKIILNGGLKSIDEAQEQLFKVDGVMLGRAAYQTPWILSKVDSEIFSDVTRSVSRLAIIDGMIDYIDRRMMEGVPLKSITRHMMGLFHGEPGARSWRRALSEEARLPDADSELLRKAYTHFGSNEYQNNQRVA
ncbi:MAG: tRNA dihydrouridine(20/20a) synthase DusA [Alphaproteobacteria bacterium]|nr:tRNA dihydrouridine(20/20a) synthase DusA [Alphaproteobacteria bacterium]